MSWSAVGIFLKLWGGYILAGAMVGGMFWFYDSWEDRGQKIKDQAAVIKSKDNVIELLKAKEKSEKEIDNDKDRRLAELAKNVQDRSLPVSPAVRSAIDSLYR